MQVVVLGGGRIGGAMAADLVADNGTRVTVADFDEEALARLQATGIDTVKVDLTDAENVTTLVRQHDFAINAVPGFMGYGVLKATIEAGRNVVDIAFFEEDPFGLHELAAEKGVVAVVDCGVSPGMSGMLVGHAASELDVVEEVVVYVGGLPEDPQWPWEYKAVFSPIDVIAEYTRPARMVDNGQVVTKPALSDVEMVDFSGIGTLEAFNTDGLRTLINTVAAPNMKEKTLRYPGHADSMGALREAGFFGEEPIEVHGQLIRPIDLTTELLFPMWQLGEGEHDLTVMRVQVDGRQEGRRVRYSYDLLDRYDEEGHVTSMARTTGYTATATLRLIHQGKYTRTGISPPEYLGREPGCLDFVLSELRERGVEYQERVETLP